MNNLEYKIGLLGLVNSLTAANLVRQVMNKENGYTRIEKTDYYTHCYEVAEILLDAGYQNDDLIAAALLHDYLEDVKGASVNQLARDFNDNIADTVLFLTKDSVLDYKQDLELKNYLNDILNNRNAFLIKLADKLSNTRGLMHPKVSIPFKKRKKKELDYYFPFIKIGMMAFPSDRKYIRQIEKELHYLKIKLDRFV